MVTKRIEASTLRTALRVVLELTAIFAIALTGTLLAAEAAGAASFIVGTTADAADTGIDGVCDASPEPGAQCTLRAAIQEANADGATAPHYIGFARTMAGGDTVTVDSLLPYVS